MTPRYVLRVCAFSFSALCCLVIGFSPAFGYYWLGIKLYYEEVSLPEAQIIRDVSYDPSAPADSKRQLDLFAPASIPGARDSRPVVVFIHGGGWENGDRRTRIAGADVYGNIGRMLAGEGFGAAVISYRLLNKETQWRAQAGDVARAIAWIQHNANVHKQRPSGVFLMGHSAGAQLAMRTAVDPQWLEQAGGHPLGVCGVIAVSGAGYDLEDAETRRLDVDKLYYVRRFASGDGDWTWRKHASPARALDSDDPPFLLMYADDDYRSLVRQSQLVHQQMRELGIKSELLIVPDADHGSIVLNLSHRNGLAGAAILKFLRDTPCPR